MHLVTEDLFMVDLPPSVGSRVIVLPILSARFELLSPAVLVACFPVSLREHLDTRTGIRRGVNLGLARQFLGFVAASGEACCQCQSNGNGSPADKICSLSKVAAIALTAAT